jgi:hypothetical protein
VGEVPAFAEFTRTRLPSVVGRATTPTVMIGRSNPALQSPDGKDGRPRPFQPDQEDVSAKIERLFIWVG